MLTSYAKTMIYMTTMFVVTTKSSDDCPTKHSVPLVLDPDTRRPAHLSFTPWVGEIHDLSGMLIEPVHIAMGNGHALVRQDP